MEGHPFIWLEADSTPLKAGWRQALEDEYYRLGKHFMLSADQNPPHDLIGGIGVYSPETSWLIPEHVPRDGWDLWMIKSIPHLVARTPLIQHSYGIYHCNTAYLHQFPRDNDIIREQAVIFHKDKLQGLMRPTKKVFSHSGDLGDIIAALPSIRALGGGEIVITNAEQTRETMKGGRYDCIRPLLESQPYITGVRWDECPQDITHEIDGFRMRQLPGDGRVDNNFPKKSLLLMQAEQLGVPNDETPWLTVARDERTRGKAIIARSPRYHNPLFPWMQVVTWLRGRAIFLGMPDEHQALERICHQQIPYIQTDNLLELAGLIAGAKLFVGNQSCPYWIAAGLGVPIVCEPCMWERNATINRPNIHYAIQPQAAIASITRYI
jgi:hypothetical protein